jgi:dTDP-4-dehydrorhamnose reductase
MIEPIATADYLTPARHPANSVLSTAAIGDAYDTHLWRWKQGLGDC